jgi:hypothetical protein
MEKYKISGPGNTTGGYKEFFMGLVMLAVGLFMLFEKIKVRSSFFTLWGHNALGPMLGIMFIGIFFLFFDVKSWIGWFLTCGSVLAILVGVITNLTIYWPASSLLNTILMFGLPVAGLGILLRSLREH